MATLTEEGASRLVHRVRSPWQNAVGGLGVVFLVWLAVHWATRHPNRERLQGLVGACVTCLLVALLSETSDFVFDAATRRLSWSRRVGLWRRAGVVPFEEIEQVVVRTSLGSSAVAPRQRVVLVTRAGELPLSASYAAGSEHGATAERLRLFLGLGMGAASPAGIEGLVAAGGDLDAIRELRLGRGMSLAEAKEEVARIRARGTGRRG